MRITEQILSQANLHELEDIAMRVYHDLLLTGEQIRIWRSTLPCVQRILITEGSKKLLGED